MSSVYFESHGMDEPLLRAAPPSAASRRVWPIALAVLATTLVVRSRGPPLATLAAAPLPPAPAPAQQPVVGDDEHANALVVQKLLAEVAQNFTNMRCSIRFAYCGRASCAQEKAGHFNLASPAEDLSLDALAVAASGD